jgi:hypothetical protein
MALLNYTKKNILGICLGGVNNDVVRLMPGINEIDSETLAKIKKNKLFQQKLDSGLVQIMADTVGKDGKRSVEDMLKHVPQIFDTKLLRKIIDSDGRERVVKAAQDQLDKIKNPKKEEETNEHFK